MLWYCLSTWMGTGTSSPACFPIGLVIVGRNGRRAHSVTGRSLPAAGMRKSAVSCTCSLSGFVPLLVVSRLDDVLGLCQ